MAYGTGITSLPTSPPGLSRCVLANRLFGHLIIFFWVQGRDLSAIKIMLTKEQKN
jgi:hypothetical protein